MIEPAIEAPVGQRRCRGFLDFAVRGMLHHRPFVRPAARERPALEWNRSATRTRAIPTVEPDDPVGRAVLAALRAGVSRIVSREADARKLEGEGVHRLRVATRRLRSELPRSKAWSSQTGASKSRGS